METYNSDTRRSDRTASGLIWIMVIVFCALLIVSALLLVARVRSFMAGITFQRDSVSQSTLAPVPQPSANGGIQESEPVSPQEEEPAAAMEPDMRESLPSLELDVQGSDEMTTFASIPDVVDAASPSVVGIIQYQKVGRNETLTEYASGSGFLVSENGYVITNAHVVSGADAVTVLFADGKTEDALVVGVDVTTDVAVLKVTGEGYAPLPIGDSSALRVGEYVIAIGNPLSSSELYGTVTFGIISATARDINIDGFVNTYLQTDAAINFGNSGGPLINMHGQVIGMNTAKTVTAGYDSSGNAVSAEGIGFALPIQNVIEIANTIIREGGMVRPGIGVQIRTIDEEIAEQYGLPVGCRIESITAGGPAEKAGLQVGDIITEVDGVAVASNDDVVSYVRSRQVGDVIVFGIYREGNHLTVEVTVGNMNGFSN